jgi:transposase
MVQLSLNGKPRKNIIRVFDLTPSSLDKWISQRKLRIYLRRKTLEELDLNKLHKENKQLLMENDALNHAALIQGQK